MRRDNDTTVQPQFSAMGAACSDPGRGLKPMRTANHFPPDRVNGGEATKTEAETEMRTRDNVCCASLFFSFSGLLGGFYEP